MPATTTTDTLKIVCDRATLVEALSMAGGVVATRSPAPALLCVRLVAKDGALSIQATDTEVGLSLTLASVEVSRDGEALIPADKLSQIAHACDDSTLTLEVERNALLVKGAHSKFKVFGYDIKLFPGVKDGANLATEFEVSGSVLRRMIARTVFATSPDSSRYAINGVLLERKARRLKMVATDGKRLALASGDCSSPADGDFSCIVPTKALKVLSRLLDDPEATVQVMRDKTRAIFAVGDGAVLSTSVVEGPFPPYQDVIPKDPDKAAVFESAELAAGVKRAALLTNEESKGVRFSFSESTLKLTSRSAEMGEAEIEVPLVSYKGEPIELGFNPGYISDVLRIAESTEMTIEMRSPGKPALIRVGNDFQYVVMPINTA
ncbi:MAG: DNA polymerase III subunit beta [Phycisphaerales bacterium]|nr:DNA polymerase III subunit beta [Phycisphaerales bacterium]